MKTYEKFIEKEAAKLGQMTDGSQHGLYFIYYSGHGCIVNHRTAGIDINGDTF